MSDGRILTALTLLGLAGAASVLKGSKGVVRRGRPSDRFDLKAMLERLIFVKTDDDHVGWIAYDPDHELPCNLFHVFAAEDWKTGKRTEPSVGHWAYTYQNSMISGSGEDDVTYELKGDGFEGTFEGKEIAVGPEAFRQWMNTLGDRSDEGCTEALIAAIVACRLEGSFGVLRKGRPAPEPREVRVLFTPSRDPERGLQGTWRAVRGDRQIGPGWYDTETGYPRQGGSGKGVAVKTALRELGFKNRISDKEMRELYLKPYPHEADLRIDSIGAFHVLAGSRGVVRAGRTTSFDVEAMLDRLILVTAIKTNPPIGWIAYDPESPLRFNLFEITHRGIAWSFSYHRSTIAGSSLAQARERLGSVEFTLDGKWIDGTEVAIGKEGILAFLPKDVATSGLSAFRSAIQAAYDEGGLEPRKSGSGSRTPRSPLLAPRSSGSRGLVRAGRTSHTGSTRDRPWYTTYVILVQPEEEADPAVIESGWASSEEAAARILAVPGLSKVARIFSREELTSKYGIDPEDDGRWRFQGEQKQNEERHSRRVQIDSSRGRRSRRGGRSR